MARILIGDIKGGQGDKGDPGAGFPTGGTKGQVLKKKSSTNFDTEWDVQSKAMVVVVPGELVVGEVAGYVPVPYPLTITGIKVFALTGPTGDDLMIDINKNGTTIYTTQANRPTIMDGDTYVVADLPDDVDLAEDDMITIDVDQIGSTDAGANLAVVIKCDLADDEFAPL